MPTKSKKSNGPKVRLTSQASKRLKEIIDTLTSQGFLVTEKSYLSELILKIPFPEDEEVLKRKKQKKKEKSLR